MSARLMGIAILAGLVASQGAWAGKVGVDLQGAATYFMGSGTPTPTGSFGFPGGGLTFNFRLGGKVDLELGANYLSRSYNNGTATTSSVVKGQLGLKFNLARAFFINLGGYYSYGLTNALTGSDIGPYVGLGLRIPLGASASIFLNPQYHYAVSSLTDAAGASITPSEVVGLVGISFGR